MKYRESINSKSLIKQYLFEDMTAISELGSDEEFNPAAEEFSSGHQVYNKKTKQSGVVSFTYGTIVGVQYYDLESGDLSDKVETTSMQDLRNDSTK